LVHLEFTLNNLNLPYFYYVWIYIISIYTRKKFGLLEEILLYKRHLVHIQCGTIHFGKESRQTQNSHILDVR